MEASKPASQVGNFGDSSEEQIARKLTWVPLPNYAAPVLSCPRLKGGTCNCTAYCGEYLGAPDWRSIHKFVNEHIEGYEYDDGAAVVVPDTTTKVLLQDCIAGLLDDEAFRAMLARLPAARTGGAV
ncbi:MAG: hypothetical protein JWR21_921 [Herminiimonas sp.]|nr:hypothetical protein [Herminiimonas sp.]